MAEMTLNKLQNDPENQRATPTKPATPIIHQATESTPKPIKKKQRIKNRGANKIITLRPTGNGKRLLPSERLAIRAEKDLGLSAEKVAKAYGVHKKTVQLIWKDDRLNAVEERVRRVKKGLSTGLTLTAHRSIQQINATIDKASARDAAVIAGVCIDKMRLLDGESTSNESVHVWMSAINDATISSQNQPAPKS